MSRVGHSKGPTRIPVTIFLELLRGQVVVFNRRLAVEILRVLDPSVHVRNSCPLPLGVIPALAQSFRRF